MNRVLFVVLSLFSQALWANEVVTKRSLQECFKAIGRDDFEVLAYSADTKTLVYDVNKESTIVLKEGSGYSLDATSTAQCKKIDMGSLERLGKSIADDVKAAVKSGKNSSGFVVCVKALQLLDQDVSAQLTEMYIKHPSSEGRHTPSTGR